MILKPKMLKVSGLNSFLEEQSVEFDKLTERGLFGIFGPTGSGKSSILDAITLSLYGQTARKSTMYINTESEKLFLSFEFEVGNGEQRRKYIIERSLKKNKTGGINTAFVKLISYDKDGNQEHIIEGRSSVESELQSNVIGLNFNDFIRTVVLPQGKFSEFLTLTGAGRNEMLERILGLENYGERLNRKAKQKRDLITQELNKIQGELSRYDGVSKESVDDLNKELRILEEKEIHIKTQIKELNQKYEEYSRIWELQSDLDNYLNISKQLEEEKEEFWLKETKLRKGKNSLNVLPHLENLQKTLKDIERSNEKLKQYNVEIDKLRALLEEKKKEYDIALNKKEKDYPVLIDRKSKVEQAIELLLQKDLLEKQIKELNIDYDKINCKINDDIIEHNELLSKEEEIESKIEKMDNLISSRTISSEYRKKLIEAADNERTYNQLLKDKEGYLIEKHKLSKSINDNNKEIAQILELLKTNDSLLAELNNKKSVLEANKPKDNNDISDYQKKIFELTNKIEKYQDTDNKVEKLTKLQAEIKIEINLLTNKYDKLTKELKVKKEKSEQIKLKIKELEYQNIANVLREKLIDAEPCPVCGSIHHPNPATSIDSTELLTNQTLSRELEREIESLNNDLIRLEQEIKNKTKEFDKNKQELDAHLKLLSEVSLVVMEKEKLSIEDKSKRAQEYSKKWDNEYKTLYDSLTKTSDERNIIDKKHTEHETIIKRDIHALKEIEIKLLELENEIGNVSIKYENQIKDLGIKNAANRLNEMNKIDEEIEKLTKDLKLLREDNKKIETEVSKLEKKINKGKEDIKIITQSINSKNSRIIELNTSIEKIIGNEDPIIMKKKIEDTITYIIEGERKLKTLIDGQSSNLNKLNEVKIGTEKAIEYLKESLNSLEKNLNKALIDNDFVSIDEVISSRLEKKDIESLEKEIELYTSRVKDTDNNILRINRELDGRSITEREWLSVVENKEKIYKVHNELIEEIGMKKSKIDEMTKNLIEVNKLKEEIKIQEKKADIISEILELTKGKRFVEYVSRSHLTYITKVASERLREITRGRYDLEYDSNNNFSIIDNYNGGARRECNSLSGGETFLTSLSLALALSSKIQLKGNISLEFFFLDEGFGTLDNNLLDVVMTSLERLYNESLSVGIISHVEELKNRVPVKLMVTPAVAGVHGTKVNIEYS